MDVAHEGFDAQQPEKVDHQPDAMLEQDRRIFG
jgi:hypothetical protein